MYSHEQLINAVRAAGRDGKTFSVKDVRVQLGFETRDKKELSRFRRRLRAFEKDAGEQLEKVGNNSYRLKPGAFESAEAPTNAVQEPASGVFETIQVPEAVAQRDAPVTNLATAETAPQPPSAATPEASSALEAVLQQPAAQLAAAGVVNLSAAHPAPAGPVAVHVAEQPAANDAPAPGAEPAAVPHAPEDVIAAQPAPAMAADAAAAAQAGANDAPAPSIAARVAELAPNGAAKVVAAVQHAVTNGAAAKAAPQPSAAVASTAPRAVSNVQRAVKLATAIVSSALAASAAVSGRVRERSINLREQLWSCIQAVPTKQHAIARLRGWAENLRPLSGQVRSQLNTLRQRVRRA